MAVNRHVTLAEDTDGYLTAARGILYSVVLAAAFWASVGVLVLWAMH